MAIYTCEICGHEYDESKEGEKFENLLEDWSCPICKSPKHLFKLIENEDKKFAEDTSKLDNENPLAYPTEFAKNNSEFEKHMNAIHQMALSGKV